MVRKPEKTKPAEEKKKKPGPKKPAQTKPAEEKKKKPGPKTKERDVRKEPLTTAEWRKIRIEYVKGKTTFEKLAEKYRLKSSYIRKRAANEGWRKKRNNLSAKVEQKILERVCDARAREFELIAAVNDSMDAVLNNLVQFIQDQPPRKYDDLRGVESLTKAIAQVVETKRNLYNVPTEIDKAKIETLRDKQKLEREKFAEELEEKAKSRQAAENTMIRVVIEGAEEGTDLGE